MCGMMYPNMPKDHNENRQLCLSFLKGVGDCKPPGDMLDWMSQHSFQDKSFALEAIRVAGETCGFDPVAKCPREIVDYEVRFALLSVYDGNFERVKTRLDDTGMQDLLPIFLRDVKLRLECFDSFAMLLFGIGIADQHCIPSS